MPTQSARRKPNLSGPGRKPRRGIVIVLTGFLLVGLFAFVALSVDTGRMVLTETEMQNAVDAAALAAAQEINANVFEAGQGNGAAVLGSNANIAAQAREVAAEVAAANGVFVDPNRDVFLGARRYDETSDSWPIEWGAEPFNTVRVVARRTESDLEAVDGELPLAFGWAVGQESVALQTTATAFVQARDLVLVLDFSGSMANDSEMRSIGTFPQEQIEASIDQIRQELLDADLRWPDQPDRKKFLPEFGKIDSLEGRTLNLTHSRDIYFALDLHKRYSKKHPKWPGQLKYPFPQSGRFASGEPRPMITSSQVNEDLWRRYIRYTRDMNNPYQGQYGHRTLINFLLSDRQIRWTRSEDMWRTSHYPFHAVKEGASLFLDFVDDLQFGDEVGLVSYASSAVQEVDHYDGEVDLDISSDPITNKYAVLDEIQRRHQAAHYSATTAIGDGLLNARELLFGDDDNPNDGNVRFGARPTIILMTDGQTNQSPDGFNLPGGFDWADYTDYDGDGVANYIGNGSHREYAFFQAVQAIERGITVHTMAVGANADNNLMRAIAFAGGGEFISVPGGSEIQDIEGQLLQAFSRIAAKVPPPSLIFDDSTNAPN